MYEGVTVWYAIVMQADPAAAFGDRRQEIVFIGINMKEDKIEELMDSCLLTDDEMLLWQVGVRALCVLTCVRVLVRGWTWAGPSYSSSFSGYPNAICLVLQVLISPFMTVETMSRPKWWQMLHRM